ncbi:MAG: crosslink repair DNA glycosylase YcaQ family protein [Chloroflexota bacterium]
MATKKIITPQSARRLAISAQQLSGPIPKANRESMLKVLGHIRCLQMDPIRAVERTQYLVLWSRLGQYDREEFHRLVYQERALFEYWAHAASFVLTEDYPLHEYMMRRYGQDGSAWSKRLRTWVKDNQSFCDFVLDEITGRGPLLTQDIKDQSKVPWASSGWTSGRSVSYMIDYLWSSGQLMVAQRDGLKRWWDLTERVLPEGVPDGGWSAADVTRDALQKSLKGLGIAQSKHINHHFIEGRYPELDRVLTQLVTEGLVEPVQVKGWEGEWFIHTEMLPLLQRIEAGDWRPRTVLLSPFDNLIRDRDRTELMWDFMYRIEIYVPQAKRQYGYYVLPILRGDRLIGRIDPKMDRKKGQLVVNQIYLESKVKESKALATELRRSIQSLGRFLEATTIEYGPDVPQIFRS